MTLTTPSNQTNTEGDSVSLTLSASTTGSGTLKYFATGLPAGLKLNSGTGVISGTVAVGDAANGPYSITVTATDGTNSASQTFTWTINSPITITDPADQTNTEGDTVSLSITATDSSSGTLKYSAVGLPPGLKINTGTGVISGTIALDAAAEGPYEVTITASDGTYSANANFVWNVDSPIVITNPGDQTNYEGDTVSLSIIASDASSGTLSYSAEGLPDGLKINPTTGVITGTAAAGDAAEGPYSVTVTVADGTYSSTSQTFTLTINDPIKVTDPGEQFVAQGNTVLLQIVATNKSSGTLEYSASGLPQGLTINATTGLISGTIDSIEANSGILSCTVTVCDGTFTNSVAFDWNIASSGDGSTSENAVDKNTLTITNSTLVKGTKGTGVLLGSQWGFVWPVFFNLSKPASDRIAGNQGYIIQKVTVTITGADGTKIYDNHSYWELFPVPRGKTSPDTLKFSAGPASLVDPEVRNPITGVMTSTNVKNSLGKYVTIADLAELKGNDFYWLGVAGKPKEVTLVGQAYFVDDTSLKASGIDWRPGVDGGDPLSGNLLSKTSNDDTDKAVNEWMDACVASGANCVTQDGPTHNITVTWDAKGAATVTNQVPSKK